MCLERLEDRLAPATYSVQFGGDAGAGMGNNGDIRYCVNQVNASTDATNTILFQINSTVQLTSELHLMKNVTIKPAGDQVITIQGNATANNPYRIFDVDSGVTAEIDDLVITGGYTNGANGGGIYNNGILTLKNDTITGNTAAVMGANGGSGGGIFNGSDGVLTLFQTTVTDNNANDFGGGIANLGALYIFNNSEISWNYAGTNGGGISSTGIIQGVTTKVIISGNSLIWNNTAANNGGGIYEQGGSVSMSGGTIGFNYAGGTGGGGVYIISGLLTLQAGVVVENNETVGSSGDGGGLYLGSNSGTELDGILVENNLATGQGNGIYQQDGAVLLGYTDVIYLDDPDGVPVQGP